MIEALSLSRVVSMLAVGTLVAAVGCGQEKPSATSAQSAKEPARAAVTLRVLVIGDEQLAEGVRLLRGEWKARSGGEMEVSTATLDDLAGAHAPARDLTKVDLLIFPSRHLGTLVERDALQTVRPSVLAAAEYAVADILPAIRHGEMKYGGQTFALPLGSPPLMLYSRRPPNENPWPPNDWTRLDAAVVRSAAAGQPAAWPLANDSAAYLLIVRALAYCEAERRFEALFDPDDMTPRIAEAPFVRALAEVAAQEDAARQGPLDFPQAVEEVQARRAVATLGWPTLVKPEAGSGDRTDDQPHAAFAPPPVGEKLYSSNQRRWTNQTADSPVTLLAVEGRLVGVGASSRNAVTAFRLAQWLTSGDIAIQLSTRSLGTLWYRKSQASAFGRWTDSQAYDGQGTPIVEIVSSLMVAETPVMTPRIPGIDGYLEALATAVRDAEPGEEGARTALRGVAAKWETITEELGRAAQLQAYRRHLGVETIGSP